MAGTPEPAFSLTVVGEQVKSLESPPESPGWESKLYPLPLAVRAASECLSPPKILALTSRSESRGGQRIPPRRVAAAAGRAGAGSCAIRDRVLNAVRIALPAGEKQAESALAGTIVASPDTKVLGGYAPGNDKVGNAQAQRF